MNVYVLDWNVRGLSQQIRHVVVREMVASTRATIVCLQETKLQHIDDHIIRETLGAQFTANYSYLPAAGTRGGILVAAADRYFSFISTATTANTITMKLQMLNDREEWTLTSVYGPQGKQRKRLFIEELKNLQHGNGQPWLLLSDFNLIYKARDKNNDRLDRRMMRKFKQALDQLELKELSLNGRKFTWSNGQEQPPMTRIDRMFCSVQWEEKFPTAKLNALASTLSDHCPLFYAGRYTAT